MSNWIIPCNSKKYDIFRAFTENSDIYWRRNNYKFKQGDKVYIYVSRPVQRIMFFCTVEEEDVSFENTTDDRKYWIKIPKNLHKKRYVKLTLEKSFDDMRLHIAKLLLNGLKSAPNGPMKLNEYMQLDKFIYNVISTNINENLSRFIKYKWEEYASYCWDVLTGTAIVGNTIYYSELSSYFDKHHRTATHMLDPIQNYCLKQKIPVLTTLVINMYSQKPGTGFKPSDFEQELAKVFSFDWESIANPFNKVANHSILAKNKTRKWADVNKNVKRFGNHRVGQGYFRNKLLKKYKNKCMLCDIQGKKLLVASHIKEWKDCLNGEHLDSNNGLLLCPNHDKVFDNHLVSFDAKGIIMISKQLNRRNREVLRLSDTLSIDLNAIDSKYLEHHRSKFIKR